MKKRLLVLSIILLCGLFSAAEASAHTHCVCASTGCEAHTASQEWMPVTELPQEAGKYYLTQDVHLNTTWEPQNGTSLCLNGFRILVDPHLTDAAIVVNNETVFQLTDCAEGSGAITGAHTQIAQINGGVMEMYGGSIEENYVSGNGDSSLLTVKSGGIFRLFGGNLCRNSSDGSVIRAEGENSQAVLFGGICSDNSVSNGVINLVSKASGRLCGVRIENNYGTAARVTTGAKLEMSAGCVSKNKAVREACISIFEGSTFHLSGGEIIDNHASVAYAGIIAKSGASVVLGGSPRVEGNTEDRIPQNLVLVNGVVVSTEADFAPARPIGVSVAKETYSISYTNGNVTSAQTGDLSKYFTSDRSGFVISYDNSASCVKLVEATGHQHCDCLSSASCGNTHDASQVYTEWKDTRSLPSEAGYYFLNFPVTLQSTWEPADGTILCFNGKKVTYAGETGSAIRILPGRKVTLCDCKFQEGIINLTNGKDGAIYAQGALVLRKLNIQKNTAQKGGAVYVAAGADVLIDNCLLRKNSASCGGGVYTEGALTVTENTIIRDNQVNETECNVFLPTGKVICTDGLTGSVGVTAEAVLPAKVTSPSNADYSRNIFSDIASTTVANTGSGNAQCVELQAKTAQDQKHSHCYCAGVDGCESHDPNIEWTPWSTSTSLPSQKGYYYLTCNVVCSQWKPPHNVYLCLNGYTVTTCLTKSPNGGSGNSTITDCAETPGIFTAKKGGSPFYCTEGDSLNLYRIRIIGNGMHGIRLVGIDTGSLPHVSLWDVHISGCKSGIYADPGSRTSGPVIDFYSGEITGCSESGVYLTGGTMRMHGGKIHGNRTSGQGGGVSLFPNEKYPSFTMNGGEISNNFAAKSGGGIAVAGGRYYGSLAINGGTICGNYAAGGGGGVGKGMYAHLTLSGGTITGNTASRGSGCLVEVANYPNPLTDVVSGTPVVDGNTGDNLYLSGKDASLILKSDAPLQNGARIGITTSVKPEQDSPVTVAATADADDHSFFFSDDARYHIINEDNKVKLALSGDDALYNISTEALPALGGTVQADKEKSKWGENVTVSASPKTGFVFLAWMENGTRVSINAQYTFAVNGDRKLTALFGLTEPAARTGLTYNGSEQTGVVEGTGYTLTGHTATDAGSYTATATLVTGYQWSDGSTEPKTIVWEIAKAAAPTAPTGLTATAPTSFGGSDGTISGVDSTMEFASDPDFADAQSCTGDTITGLAAGTYYVRVKETENTKAGVAAQIAVSEGVNTIAIPVATTDLTYNGSEKTGVVEGTGYTLTGHTATNAGSYTATATLATGYQWSDGSTEPKTIVWEIDKAAAPAEPTGLTATAPTSFGGSDGTISGVDSTMEFASDPDFADAQSCTGDTITGLAAGTYYVRVKETENTKAGVAAQIAVSEGVNTIAIPVATTGLTYNGSEQTGVVEGTGYTLTGHTATNAGSYTATATLATGYQWSDGSTEPKTIVWEIAKAAAPAAPTGLTATAPTSFGGSDGTISGVDSTMEFASDPDFADAQSCTGDTITGLAAGTYYVRVKETANVNAGSPVQITISDGVNTIAIPVATTGLTYNGSEQTGVVEGTGYTLTGHTATNAGSYTATATLVTGYQWSDGSTEPKTIVWEIAKAAAPTAPTGLTATAPTSFGGSDGTIFGVDSTMEYSADGITFYPCTDESISGLKAGTYYVRFKETRNTKASISTTLVINEPVGSVPVIFTISLPNGVIGTAYSYPLQASGTGPIEWSLADGSALPAGLSLSKEGLISGTPATVGTVSFTAKAKNSAGEDEVKLTLTIDAVPTAPQIITVEVAPSHTFIQGKASTTTITIGRGLRDLSANNFASLTVDGQRIQQDRETFEVYSGSVIVRLHPAYLNTLSVGEHHVVIGLQGSVYDGRSVETRITVIPEASTNASPMPPKTGDTSHPVAWLTTILLALFGAVGLISKRKRA